MVKQEPDVYPYSVTDLSHKDALIIAPHPDDESLGCGGSLSRHTSKGSRVKIIFLTDGDKGDFEGRFGKEYVEIRRKSAKKALHILGVIDFEFWGYKDRDFHQVAPEIKERLLSAVETFSPSLIYAPSPLEAHPDHRVASELVWNIRNDVGEAALVFYEVLMALYPNILVDITAEMKTKRRAIESYFTEVYYNDYVSKVEGLNRFRTATLPKHITYAEAFILLEHGTSLPNSFPVQSLFTMLE